MPHIDFYSSLVKIPQQPKSNKSKGNVLKYYFVKVTNPHTNSACEKIKLNALKHSKKILAIIVFKYHIISYNHSCINIYIQYKR